MKSVAILACALLGAVHAQDISSVPQCGVSLPPPFVPPICHAPRTENITQQTCIQNMLKEQANLGCPPVNGQPDPSCLCKNADFSFGLRDCSQQACGSDVADAVVSYGVAYCRCK